MNIIEKIIKKFTYKKIEKIQLPDFEFTPPAPLSLYDMRSDPGFEEAILHYSLTYGAKQCSTKGPKRMKLTIPVSVTKEQAEQSLRDIMGNYYTRDNWDIGYTPEKEIKRVYSELDPYGEENWDEEDIDYKNQFKWPHSDKFNHFR